VQRDSIRTLYLNLGHFYDHMFMLLFATAVLKLAPEFGVPYGVMLAYSTPAFVAFGAGALPAGWLGDRWSRAHMMTLFFVGIGFAAVLTGFARTAWQIGAGLLAIGIFASIYHPCGIAMLVEGRDKVGRLLGVNGLAGNMGVAAAGLIAGVLTDLVSWRAAFIVPGLVSIATGLAFAAFARREARAGTLKKKEAPRAGIDRALMVRVFAVIVVATTLGGLIFNATTVAMPKLIDERVASFAAGTSDVGLLVAAIFAVAAFSQILVGHLIDKHPVKPVFLAVLAMQAPVLLLLGGLADLPLFLGALLLMCLVFGQIPIMDTLIARHTANEWRSRVYAVKYVLALGVAASAVPLTGFLHEWSGGFQLVLTIMGILAAVIAVAGLALPGAPQPRPIPVAGDD
jgi:MFS family permease